MSTEALRLIAQAKKEKTKVLDLGNCGLTELPEELFELHCLEELYVSNRYWDLEKGTWIESTNSGKPNKLSKIPVGIHNLKQLKKLVIGGEFQSVWKIKDISVLAPLTSLTSLDLGNNQISDISVSAGFGKYVKAG